MQTFKEGRTYYNDGNEITVIKRTKKTVTVTNGRNTWRMRIKTDAAGVEYVADSTTPKKWRFAFTYTARDTE